MISSFSLSRYLSSMITITDLSDYDLVYIFEYLDIVDLMSIRRVCRLFRDLSIYARCGGGINYNSYEDIIFRAKKCTLINEMPLDRVTKCTDVTCLFDVPNICELNECDKVTVVGLASSCNDVNIRHLVANNFFLEGPLSYLINIQVLDLYKLTWSGTSIEGLPNLRELVIKCGNLDSINNLPSLEKLDVLLLDVKEVHNLPNLKIMECNANTKVDFSTIPKLEVLSYNCLYTDTNEYVNCNFDVLKEINIYNSRNVRLDVLSKVERAKFSNCELIDDVSSLVNVRRLNIKKTRVRDITMLTKLEYLNISQTEVLDLPEGNRIHTLIAEFYKGNSISNIDHVEYLDISYSKITKLPDNNIITTLKAERSLLSDASNVKNLKCLHASERCINKLPPLDNIEEIDVSFTNFSSLKGLENARVVIAYSTNIKELVDFKRIEKLDISFTEINNVPYYPTLKTLYAVFTELENVNHLTSLTDLNCTMSSVEDVSCLTKLVSLRMRDKIIASPRMKKHSILG